MIGVFEQYRTTLNEQPEVSFLDALRCAQGILRSIPDEEQTRIYDTMDRGRAILKEDRQCAVYMAWLAKKHIAKFSAAFELLPKDICQNVIDVYDWGSGIGLASFAFRDWYNEKFPERKYAKRVRSVTLIEPSERALAWAVYNAGRCFPESRIRPIQKTFAELADDDFADNRGAALSRVHIFSNVLDINEIGDRSVVGDLVEKFRRHAMGWNDVIVLISPLYNQIEKIYSDFRDELMHDRSETLEVLLDTTPFTRERANGDSVNVRGAIAVWRITSKEQGESLRGFSAKWRHLYDQFLLDESAPNGMESLLGFIHRLTCSIPDSEIGFRYRQNVYGTTPDLMIFRKGYCPILICFGKSGADNEEQTPDSGFMEPVENVHRELFKNNRELYRLESAFGSVVAVAYNPRFDCLCVYKGKDNNSGRIYEWKTDIPWKRLSGETYRVARKAIVDYVKGARRMTDIKPMSFDRKQARLIVSRPGAQKVEGCFGSGKTTVLVERAISACRRTHRRVLILTYNLSLRTHIEHVICSRMDEGMSMFGYLVLNIHQFIKSYGMNRLGFRGNVVNFMGQGENALRQLESRKDELEKFSTILVDECQDYEYEWLEILKRIFLVDDGEYVVFGDAKQNVYDRSLDEGKFKTNVLGRWNALTKCHRSAGRLLNFILRLQMCMPKYESDVIIQQTLAFDDSVVDIRNVRNWNAANCVRAMIDILRNDDGEVTVMAESHDFLRELESRYRNLSRKETEVMFWRSEEYSDESKRKNRDERDLKLFFDGDRTDVMKFSTIESFKGFESRTVILFVERHIPRSGDCLKELLYTAVTRARSRLYVFNLGNEVAADVFAKVEA